LRPFPPGTGRCSPSAQQNPSQEGDQHPVRLEPGPLFPLKKGVSSITGLVPSKRYGCRRIKKPGTRLHGTILWILRLEFRSSFQELFFCELMPKPGVASVNMALEHGPKSRLLAAASRTVH
ncbi:hypothetical protein BGZ93_003230, partial [Podila epicladia]